MSKKDIAHSSVVKMKSAALDGERKLRVIATSPTLDRDKEVIDSETIRIPLRSGGWKYLKDMTTEDKPDIPFLLDHWWDLEKQAGSLDSIYINEDGKTEAIVNLSTVDNGERVYTLAKEGHLGNSFSIGMSLMDATLADNTWYNVELLELSAVFKGSNPDARLLEVKSTKKEQSMSDIEAKKAQIATLQKEVEEAEAAETETQTEETKPKAEEATGADAEKEETKTVKKEEEDMSDVTDIAKKQVMPKVEAPDVEVATTKGITKRAARELMAKHFTAIAAEDNEAAKSIAEEIAGKKVIDGTSGKPLMVEEVFAEDVRLAYQKVGNIGQYVNKVDILGAETYRELVETSGVGFQRVRALGGKKPLDNPTWAEVRFEPKEWAVIVPWLDAVARRTPLAVYQYVVRYVARQFARLEDKVILTYAGGNLGGGVTDPANGVFPILEAAGRVIPVASYNAGDVTDALGDAYGRIESDGTLILVANRKTWGKLAVSKDKNDHPVFARAAEAVTAGALGEFRLVQSTEAPDGKVVIGDFQDYLYVTRGGLEQLFSQEATLDLGGGETLNLFQQNASALRASAEIEGGVLTTNSFVELDFSSQS